MQGGNSLKQVLKTSETRHADKNSDTFIAPGLGKDVEQRRKGCLELLDDEYKKAQQHKWLKGLHLESGAIWTLRGFKAKSFLQPLSDNRQGQ